MIATTPLPTVPAAAFSFAVAADTRQFAGPGIYDTAQYFRGAVEALRDVGNVRFLVSPGDMDPVPGVYWTITTTLGTDFTWYPLVGNHELPMGGYESDVGANLAWLNRYDYGSVIPGPSGCPATTYAFDHGNAHLVVLNVYCDAIGDDATDGDIPDHLYEWLVADLAATDREHIFVFGHEPAYPQPDADNGRRRHVGDSLDQYPAHRDRFWKLLRDNNVTAYICGHTHNYSAKQIGGVWQLDVAHARGLGDPGARSTFVLLHVRGGAVRYEVYRDDAQGGDYTLAHGGHLAGMITYLPVIAQGE